MFYVCAETVRGDKAEGTGLAACCAALLFVDLVPLVVGVMDKVSLRLRRRFVMCYLINSFFLVSRFSMLQPPFRGFGCLVDLGGL